MGDDEVIETDALFTRPVRTLFGKAFRHSWFKHVPKLTYAVLVGRNVTTDAQALDDIVDILGRVKTNPYAVGATVGVTSVRAISGTLSSALRIGEFFEFTVDNDGAGGDAVFPTTIESGVSGLYEIWQCRVSANIENSVGTRTLRIAVVTGLAQATGVGAIAEDVSSNVTLTQDQNGGVWWGKHGVALLNDNATITEDTIPSPCPFLMDEGGSITADVGTGLAGDTANVSGFGRRVA